jgi:hypothetical protein
MNAEPNGDSETAHNNESSDPAASPEALPPYGHDTPPKQNEWRINDRPIFFVTLAGVLAVVAYTTVAAWQACLTRGQLNEMRAEQRAWIGAPKIEGTFNGSVYQFWLTFRNIGHVPATELFISARTVESSDWQAVGTTLCNHDIAKDTATPTKWAIAPGDEFPIEDGGKDNPEIQINFPNGKFKFPHIVGCVIYRVSPDDPLHHTEFVAPLAVNYPKVKAMRTWTPEVN